MSSYVMYASWRDFTWRPTCGCGDNIKPNSKEIKVKFSLERAMKAQRGSRGIALLFL
jgi:hypothetical protein